MDANLRARARVEPLPPLYLAREVGLAEFPYVAPLATVRALAAAAAARAELSHEGRALMVELRAAVAEGSASAAAEVLALDPAPLWTELLRLEVEDADEQEVLEVCADVLSEARRRDSAEERRQVEDLAG